MAEKLIEEMTIRLSESLKRDLQDVAAQEDRALSVVICQILELYLYGYKHRADLACGKEDSCQTRRGE